MSTPTPAPALPEDCAACDEHEEVYPIGGSCPECDLVEVRELAKRWAAYRSLTADEAGSVEFAQNQRGHGIDCLIVSPGHPRERLVSLEDRGLLSWTMCQPTDGDGYSTGEDEVEGWELTELGNPPTNEEGERLFAWARERVADWLAAGVASGLEQAGDDAVRPVLLMHVAQDLGMSLVDCEALIDAAKAWPS